MSHGGATMNAPASTAVSARCDRAAQSSSDTSSVAMVRSMSRSLSARSRGVALVRRREEHAPVERRRRRLRRRRVGRIPEPARWEWLRRRDLRSRSASDRRAPPTRGRSRAGVGDRGSAESVSAGQSRRSSKDVFDLLEQAAVVGPRRRLECLRRQRLGQLLEELALFARELARRDRLHRDEQIAAAASR